MTETLKNINAQVKKCLTDKHAGQWNGKCLNLIRCLSAIHDIHSRKKMNQNESYYTSNMLYNIGRSHKSFEIRNKLIWHCKHRDDVYFDVNAEDILKEINDMANNCIHNQSPQNIDTLASLRLISKYHKTGLQIYDKHCKPMNINYDELLADHLEDTIEWVNFDTGEILDKMNKFRNYPDGPTHPYD